MKISSNLFDARINATNILIELSIGEYEKLVKEVIANNEFQRKRVRSSKTVYALLREDILKQCVIPPIVLALTTEISDAIQSNEEEFIKKISEQKDHLVILDGLQRTYTIFDLLADLRGNNDEITLERMLSSKLRIEIYVGLNRLGILYRMLTLNTGQTPMSLRQQIEMLYLDYLSKPTEGIELIKESDGKMAKNIDQYNFKDVVEGFNAYLDRDELPIDKANILENINSLEKLSRENQSSELFEKYLTSLHSVIKKLVELCGDASISEDYEKENGTPFGKNATQVFKKPQAISGYGAALGKLIDFEALKQIDDVSTISSSLVITDSNEFLEEVNNALLWLKNNSKKIGNAQRNYFTFFFRDLLNPDADTFKNPVEASKSALRKYQAQNM
ncbi:DUF262 domain-containing protein [Saccharospirillum sp.]|uniref:GmrSD restriction endonuclease domain-containing protein n=1 Tax=Saccharospirillum sp. TaxID=2033801 RepID=UPI00349FF634